MRYPYSEDGEGIRVLAHIRNQFSQSRLFARSDRHIVFVCGGDTAKVTVRSQFLEYAGIHLPHIRILLPLPKARLVDVLGTRLLAFRILQQVVERVERIPREGTRPAMVATIELPIPARATPVLAQVLAPVSRIVSEMCRKVAGRTFLTQ